MNDAKALAAKLRRAALLAAVENVEPGRTLMTVLRRMEEIDFVFDEFADYILTGKGAPRSWQRTASPDTQPNGCRSSSTTT